MTVLHLGRGGKMRPKSRLFRAKQDQGAAVVRSAVRIGRVKAPEQFELDRSGEGSDVVMAEHDTTLRASGAGGEENLRRGSSSPHRDR